METVKNFCLRQDSIRYRIRFHRFYFITIIVIFSFTFTFEVTVKVLVISLSSHRLCKMIVFTALAKTKQKTDRGIERERQGMNLYTLKLAKMKSQDSVFTGSTISV